MSTATEPYTLEALADDIRTSLKADSSRAGLEKICTFVSRALLDQELVAKHLKDRALGEHPREVLYEDEETGFCICGHVYNGEAIGEPHCTPSAITRHLSNFSNGGFLDHRSR